MKSFIGKKSTRTHSIGTKNLDKHSMGNKVSRLGVHMAGINHSTQETPHGQHVNNLIYNNANFDGAQYLPKGLKHSSSLSSSTKSYLEK